MHYYLIRLLLLSSFVFCNDGQGPLFTNMIPESDFFQNNPIQIDIQAVDSDGIDEVILYYKFSSNDNYKNLSMGLDINYSVTIPAFEVNSDKIQYYFLAIDKFGNKNQYPDQGELNPLEVPILGENIEDYEINLINPLEHSINEALSILILSLYSRNNEIIKNDIQIVLDNQDITKECNISEALITYVPSNILSDGEHTLTINFLNNDLYFSKTFSFSILESTSIAYENIILDVIKKINYSANISYTSDYDKFYYEDKNTSQPDSKPLDIHRVNLNLKARYKQVDLRSSILFNTHLIDGNARYNKKYKQPIDRIKLGVKVPFEIPLGLFDIGAFASLNIGDYSTNFSELTLKGTRVRGLHTSLELGVFKISYVHGRTKELIQAEHEFYPGINNSDLPTLDLDDGRVLYYKKGTPSRNLTGMRTEFTFGKQINFGLSGLTSYDVMSSLDAPFIDVPFEELYSNYLFLGNSVIGTDATLFFNNKRNWIKAETAISMTYDLQQDKLDDFIADKLDEAGLEDDALVSSVESLLNTVSGYTGYYLTSDILLANGDGRGLSIPLPGMDTTFALTEDPADYLQRIFKEGTYKIKFKMPFSLLDAKFNFNGEYKRVPFTFNSFGSPSISKDIKGLSSDLSIKLFKNQVVINLGYNNHHDNISEFKDPLSTVTSLGNNIGANLNFSKLPSISYSRKTLNRQDLSGAVDNSSFTHTIIPSYKFNLNNYKITLNTNIVVMNYYDFSSSENNDFTQLSLSSSGALMFDNISINIGSGYSNNKPKDSAKFETSFKALSSKISYKFKNNKLNSFFGINKITGENLDPVSSISNDRLSLKLGAQYKINDYASVQSNMEYLLYSDTIEPDRNYSELKGKLAFKINL